ncbi:MAG: hypothetical protein QW794_00600 [Thermosphaera sp.]
MEDYIDFPCSPTWLDWYHEQGLTPRRSSRKDKELVDLYKRIARLEEILLEVLEEIKAIKLANAKEKEPLEDLEALERKEELERKFLEVYQKVTKGRWR